jgi:hypothetical protein
MLKDRNKVPANPFSRVFKFGVRQCLFLVHTHKHGPIIIR